MEKAVADIIAVPKAPSTTEKPFGTSTGEAARRLHLVSRIISSLPKPELEQIFQKMMGGSGETGELKK